MALQAADAKQVSLCGAVSHFVASFCQNEGLKGMSGLVRKYNGGMTVPFCATFQGVFVWFCYIYIYIFLFQQSVS